jgi:hypothetical protein
MTQHIADRDKKLVLLEFEFELIGLMNKTATENPQEYSYKKYGYMEALKLLQTKNRPSK